MAYYPVSVPYRRPRSKAGTPSPPKDYRGEAGTHGTLKYGQSAESTPGAIGFTPRPELSSTDEPDRALIVQAGTGGSLSLPPLGGRGESPLSYLCLRPSCRYVLCTSAVSQ